MSFTADHSITLALAIFGFANLRGPPVEVMIAVSILVTAAHAMRPIFPGREALVAACFGLINCFAFAATLAPPCLGGWERVTAIAGFNLVTEAI
jgi:hypothetical protein